MLTVPCLEYLLNLLPTVRARVVMRDSAVNVQRCTIKHRLSKRLRGSESDLFTV